MREWHPAALIQLEVLARGRRALLVYGLGHLQRKNVHSNFEIKVCRAQTILSLAEAESCDDPRHRAHMNMRLTRIEVTGIPPAEAERLKKHCAEVASK
jgi:hypothetical protein